MSKNESVASSKKISFQEDRMIVLARCIKVCEYVCMCENQEVVAWLFQQIMIVKDIIK